MKIFFSSLFITFLFSAYAQTTAEDWTTTDCKGTEHNLFSDLDSGYAVIMEFVMLPDCMPCINAAHNMEPIVDWSNSNYDDRVKYYVFEYSGTYTCPDLMNWETSYDINTSAVFYDGSDILTYYGAFGMPTTVVAGRTSHTVYYHKTGFLVSDTTAFSQGIKYALGIEDPVEGIFSPDPEELTIFPDPAKEKITVQYSGSESFLKISSVNGAEIISKKILSPDPEIDISDLPRGLYIFTLQNESGFYAGRFFVQ